MPRPKSKLLIWPVLALLLIGGGYALWEYTPLFKQKESSEVPENLVTKAEKRTIKSNLLLTGEVTPAFAVEIKSEISGRVEVIHVKTGQLISRGDPMITIDDKDLLTERSSALTEIEGAKLEVGKRRGNFERAQALYEEKLISKEVYANLHADLLISENNLVKAEAKLQTVDDKLSKTRLLAPADGTVLNINVSEGQVVVGATSVNAGNILMNFADLSRLMIQTHVNQMDIAKVEPGDEITISMPGTGSSPVKAIVEFVAPVATVKNSIKGFAVEAVIQDLDERLRPGMSVSMELPVASANETVSVPISAVFHEEDGKSYVYVRQGGSASRRTVQIGLSDFSFAEIKEGLEAGEEILLVQPRDLAEQG